MTKMVKAKTSPTAFGRNENKFPNEKNFPYVDGGRWSFHLRLHTLQ